MEILDRTRLPHVGSDLIFALVLGLLNALIYPVLKVIGHEASLLKIALAALILNFGAYAVVKLASIGIQILTVEGYIFVSAVVTVGSILSHFFQMKYDRPPNVEN